MGRGSSEPCLWLAAFAFTVAFSSATNALECAIAIQSAFAERNESAAEPIKVRIGLNAGEPIAEDEDLYGTAMALADAAVVVAVVATV